MFLSIVCTIFLVLMVLVGTMLIFGTPAWLGLITGGGLFVVSIMMLLRFFENKE